MNYLSLDVVPAGFDLPDLIIYGMCGLGLIFSVLSVLWLMQRASRPAPRRRARVEATRRPLAVVVPLRAQRSEPSRSSLTDDSSSSAFVPLSAVDEDSADDYGPPDADPRPASDITSCIADESTVCRDEPKSESSGWSAGSSGSIDMGNGSDW